MQPRDKPLNKSLYPKTRKTHSNTYSNSMTKTCLPFGKKYFQCRPPYCMHFPLHPLTVLYSIVFYQCSEIIVTKNKRHRILVQTKRFLKFFIFCLSLMFNTFCNICAFPLDRTSILISIDEDIRARTARKMFSSPFFARCLTFFCLLRNEMLVFFWCCLSLKSNHDLCALYKCLHR